jgi:chromosome segregation ATPase
MKNYHDGEIIRLKSQLIDDATSMTMIKEQYKALQLNVDEMEAAKAISNRQITFLKNKTDQHVRESNEFKDFKTSVEIRQSSLQKVYYSLAHSKKIADTRIVTLENQLEKENKSSLQLAERLLFIHFYVSIRMYVNICLYMYI